jgi:hypothetical protein
LQFLPVMSMPFGSCSNAARSLVERRMKIDILKENTEAGMVIPGAVEAWEGFLGFLIGARLKQDFPAIVKLLSSASPADRLAALERVESAADRGIEIEAAVPRLRELTADSDEGARGGAVPCSRRRRRAGWMSRR